MKNSLKVFGFLLGVVLFFQAPQVFAQKVLEDMRKEMPEFEAMSQEDFEAQTILHDEVPYSQQNLHYKVRLPRGWQQAKTLGLGGFSVSEKVLVEVARYYGPANFTARSHFTVQARALEYQLTAEQWLALYLIENGYTIQGFEKHTPSRAEAVYILVEGDVTYVVRSVADITGKQVLFASYAMPLDDWESQRALQDASINSFVSMYEAEEFAEQMKPYQFLDIAQIQYPVSWVLRSEPLRSIDRMYIELLSVAVREDNGKQKQVLNGKVDVHLISDFIVEDLEQEIESFKSTLQEGEILLGDLISEPEDFVDNESFDFYKTYVYEAVSKNASTLDYELWINVAYARGYYYFTTLLTPSRHKDFFLWSKNTQTYRLINNLIDPLDSMLEEN